MAFAASVLLLCVIVIYGVDSPVVAVLSYGALMKPEDGYGWLGQVTGSSIWLLVFLRWQRIRDCLRSHPKLVFLDKLCIHQTDPELKAEGIYGLAGFLRASKTILVLWSPRYFTRLWCAYELAAWCSLNGKDKNDIVIYPLRLSSKIIAWFVFISMITVFANYVHIKLWLWFVFAFAGVFVIIRVSREANLELAALQNHLESFSFQSTQCFCCSVNHIHPQTGEPLVICDRRLVYEQLASWQQERSHSQPEAARNKSSQSATAQQKEEEAEDSIAQIYSNDYFTEFDERVKSFISASMLRSVRLSYRQALFPSMSILCVAADRLPFVLLHEWRLRYVLDITVTVFLFLPLSLRVFDKLYERLGRCTQRLHWFIDVVAASGCTVLLLGTWALQQYVLWIGEWPVVIVQVVLEALATWFAYSKPWNVVSSATGCDTYEEAPVVGKPEVPRDSMEADASCVGKQAPPVADDKVVANQEPLPEKNEAEDDASECSLPSEDPVPRFPKESLVPEFMTADGRQVSPVSEASI
eukprot:TRINITY_DN11607_c0_g1_i4.p1 TRINITY_DN11607_c0_g1~~TRINITY_DN11607_c0_g1_i4.p1  ORF type:complete len:526 (+),score=46.12 TRINITY_DN11607_c0_g1_i4:203-1780(+)